MTEYNRRKFIQTSTLGVIATSSLSLNCQRNLSSERKGSYMGDFKDKPLENIRAAFIGINRGSTHLKNFANLPGTEIVALCDLYEDIVVRELKKLASYKANFSNVKTYWGDKNQWKVMLKEVRPDVVFISTKKHCMMMENVNYGRDELMFLNICRKGLIGELLHAEAAYIHELRWQMFNTDRGTGNWRTLHYSESKGNLYPTHGLGPVAQYMNLARHDDNFKHIISLSSPAIGRNNFANENFDSNHKWNKMDFSNGDINSSIIKTNLGRTVLVQWDETSPRPYTRHNLIQGTKGILAGFPTRVALEEGVEGVTKDHHSWVQGDNLNILYEKYDHPLYKRLNEKTISSGHGGMDGIMMYRIVECLKNGLALDQNVYEGCFWSAITPLSARSIERDGAPESFPDFTRGDWKKTKTLKIVS